MQRSQFNDFQTTYELAVKLRDHGYPQPTQDEARPGGIFYSEPSATYGPSASELIGKLIAMKDFHRYRRVGPKRCFAWSISGKRVSGATMVETLANLWCALNKMEIKRKNSR